MPENYCIPFRWVLQLVQKLDLMTICSAISDVFRIIVKATLLADMAMGTGGTPPLIVFRASRAVRFGGMNPDCALFIIWQHYYLKKP
jgi:hypothetical protein